MWWGRWIQNPGTFQQHWKLVQVGVALLQTGRRFGSNCEETLLVHRSSASPPGTSPLGLPANFWAGSIFPDQWSLDIFYSTISLPMYFCYSNKATSLGKLTTTTMSSISHFCPSLQINAFDKALHNLFALRLLLCQRWNLLILWGPMVPEDFSRLGNFFLSKQIFIFSDLIFAYFAHFINT